MLTGPIPVTEKVLKRAGMKKKRHRPVRAQRGLRLGGAALHAGARHSARQDQRQRRRHRHGPSARRHRRDDPRHRARRTGAHAATRPRWSRSASASAWAPRRSSSGSDAEDRYRQGAGRRSDHLSAASSTRWSRAVAQTARRRAPASRNSASTSAPGSGPAPRRRCATGTKRKTSSSICSRANSCCVEDERRDGAQARRLRGLEGGRRRTGHQPGQSHQTATPLYHRNRHARRRASARIIPTST